MDDGTITGLKTKTKRSPLWSDHAIVNLLLTHPRKWTLHFTFFFYQFYLSFKLIFCQVRILSGITLTAFCWALLHFSWSSADFCQVLWACFARAYSSSTDTDLLCWEVSCTVLSVKQEAGWDAKLFRLELPSLWRTIFVGGPFSTFSSAAL